MHLANTTRDYTHTVVAQTLGRVVSVAALPLTLRLFTPGEYATFSLFITAVLIAGLLVNWTANALWRFGTEEFAREGTCRNTFWSVQVLRLPCLALILALAVGMRDPILRFTQLPETTFPAVLLILALGAPEGLHGLLQGQQRFRAAAWILQVPTLLNASAVMLMTAGLLPATSSVLVYTVALGSVFMHALTLAALRHSIAPRAPSAPLVEKIWRFSWPFFFHGVGLYAIEYTDTLLLRRYASLEAVGLYAVAASIYAFMRVPIQHMAPLIMPGTIRAELEGQRENMRWFYTRIVPQTVLAVSLAVALAMSVLPLLAPVLGPRFVGTLAPLTVLMPALGLQVVTVLATPLFYAVNRTRTHVLATQIAALATLGAGLLLVPRLGVTGAALAKLLGEGVNMLTHGHALRRELGVSLVPAAGWTAPLWAVVLAGLAGFGMPTVLGLWAAVTVGVLALGRRLGLFDRQSAAFLRRLGLPVAVATRLIPLYERFLIGPNSPYPKRSST